MKEPKRLFESGSPLERSILGFGRDDAPSDELARKTLAAMADAPPASAAPAAPARAVSATRPRWILAGACALGIAAVIVGIVRRDEGPTSVPPTPVAPTEAPLVVSAPEPAPVPVKEEVAKEEVAVTPDSLPSAPVRAPAPQAASASARAAAPIERPSSASIAREVELLDTVKARLGTRDAAAAARALDAYDSEFPSGTLRPEATVLRIRMLLLRGDRGGAEKVGQAFLAKHPSGVHAKRVRALLADEAPIPAQ